MKYTLRDASGNVLGSFEVPPGSDQMITLYSEGEGDPDSEALVSIHTFCDGGISVWDPSAPPEADPVFRSR
jgi:hypothetical protein